MLCVQVRDKVEVWWFRMVFEIARTEWYEVSVFDCDCQLTRYIWHFRLFEVWVQAI